VVHRLTVVFHIRCTPSSGDQSLGSHLSRVGKIELHCAVADRSCAAGPTRIPKKTKDIRRLPRTIGIGQIKNLARLQNDRWAAPSRRTRRPATRTISYCISRGRPLPSSTILLLLRAFRTSPSPPWRSCSPRRARVRRPPVFDRHPRCIGAAK
jgi:hypothetical protein